MQSLRSGGDNQIQLIFPLDLALGMVYLSFGYYRLILDEGDEIG
jgi:hypothetical protein